MGQVGATPNDELPGYASNEYKGDSKHDDAWMTDEVADPGHLRGATGANSKEKIMSEYVAALQARLRAAYLHAITGLQRAAMHQHHSYECRDKNIRQRTWCGFTTS